MSEVIEEPNLTELNGYSGDKDVTVEVSWGDVMVSLKTPSRDLDMTMLLSSLVRTTFLSLPTNESTRKSFSLYTDEIEGIISKKISDGSPYLFQIPVPKILYMTLELIIPDYNTTNISIMVHNAL